MDLVWTWWYRDKFETFVFSNLLQRYGLVFDFSGVLWRLLCFAFFCWNRVKGFGTFGTGGTLVISSVFCFGDFGEIGDLGEISFESLEVYKVEKFIKLESSKVGKLGANT